MSNTIQEVKWNVDYALKNNSEEELISWISDFLLDHIGKELGESSKKINVSTNFSDMGIDSHIVNLFNNEMYKIIPTISKTVLFETNNIKQLAEYLVENHRDEITNIKNIDFKDDDFDNEEIIKESAEVVEDSIEKKVNLKQESNREMEDNWEDDWDKGFDEFLDEPSNNKIKNYVEDKQEIVKADLERKVPLIEPPSDNDIAIIGVSGRYPLADSVDEFWNNILNGTECITEIPIERWNYKIEYDPDKTKSNKVFSKWGGFIRDVDKFDPMFFNMTPMDAEGTDPQERLFLQVAYEALEDAGYTKTSLEGKKVGVFIGAMYSHYSSIGVEESVKGNNISLNSLHASIANRISYYFNLSGPSIAIDTMCSSSITALYFAVESIKAGNCDMAIVGGVNLTLHPDKYRFLCGGKLASSEGKCRAFGAGGDGYVPGEGIGAIILKRVDKSNKNRDQIYATIKGVSINHGGRTNGYTVPNPNAQAEVIKETLKKTGIDPRSITYVEAHGTGTPLGDPIEITGITKAYREYTDDNQFCAIGSVKANIGHLESAAGIAAITKVILQMKNKKLAPTILSDVVNPSINFAQTPFYLQHDVSQWNRPVINENGIDKEYLRRAAISSFGAGGSNAHIIIEEFDDRKLSDKSDVDLNQKEIIVFSARNSKQLKTYAENMLNYLSEAVEINKEKSNTIRLSDIAYTLQVGREAMTERIAMVVSNIKDLIEKLKLFCEDTKDIKNFYRGDKNRLLDELLLTGEEGELYLKGILASKKLEKIATLWVLGVNFDWENFNAERNVTRISLPTYPFDKRSCWPVEVKNSLVEIVESIRVDNVHPLIDENRSTLEEQCFTKCINENTMYVGDYLISNEYKVSPSLFTEMIWYSATSSSRINKVNRIYDLEFLKECTLKSEPINVNVSILSDGGDVNVQVWSSDYNEDDSIFCSGKCEYIDVEEDLNSTLEIKAQDVIERCGIQKVQKDFYDIFIQNNIEYGNSFKRIKEFGKGENETISYLQLSRPNNKFLINPEVLEGAIQSILYSALHGINHDEQQYKLSYIDEIRVYKEIKNNAYVHVKFTDDINKEVNEELYSNILIFDGDGEVAIEINNIMFLLINVKDSQ